MESTKKNNRGGKRDGAGRKKTVTGRYYGFNSTAETQAILDNLDIPRSEFINAAIKEYAAKKMP